MKMSTQYREIVSKTASLVVATFLLACTSCSHRIEAPPVDDNTLLDLILSRSGSDGWVLPSGATHDLDFNDPSVTTKFLQDLKDDPPYTVVAPQTSFGLEVPNDPNEVEQCKKHIKEDLKIRGYDLTEVIDLLFERNKTSVRLTLESSRTHGYIVDYDGERDKYFKKDGGGWEKWYKDHPRSTGFTSVSLPAYDPKTGIVLVYEGIMHDGTFGSGGFIAYKYKRGKLRQIGYAGLWIS